MHVFFIAGPLLLHPGAQGRGAPEALSEHGWGPEGGPTLYPETYGESKPHYGARIFFKVIFTKLISQYIVSHSHFAEGK